MQAPIEKAKARYYARAATSLQVADARTVRKEIWTHILAYNLIRTMMAQATTKHVIEPRTISLEAFQPLFAIQADRDREHRRNLY
jgi:hypothetical protein